jgi:hypothetical protein
MPYWPDKITREEIPYYREHLHKAKELLLQFEIAISENDPDHSKCLDLLTQINEEFYRLGTPGFQQTTSDC